MDKIEMSKVLIVDSNPDQLLLVQTYIKQIADVEVFEASSLSEARRMIDTIRPNLVASDLIIDGGWGIDAYQHMKKSLGTNCEFLMFTSFKDFMSKEHRAEITVIERPEYKQLQGAVMFLEGKRKRQSLKE